MPRIPWLAAGPYGLMVHWVKATQPAPGAPRLDDWNAAVDAFDVDAFADRVAATVADNGPGVPEAEYDKVFRRLYRLDKSRATPGSGLGLSLVRAIADLHGATIRLEDRKPGIAVVVAFPGVGFGDV